MAIDVLGPERHAPSAAFDQAADWPTPRWRINNAVTAAGDWARDVTGRDVESARIRWKWSCKFAHEEPPPATHFKENPRLYTYLPCRAFQRKYRGTAHRAGKLDGAAFRRGRIRRLKPSAATAT